MISVKLEHNGEVRRVAFDDKTKSLRYDVLSQKAQAMFGLRPPLKFAWTDDEGDSINCCTDEEISEAVRVQKGEKPGASVRFTVQGSEEGPPQPQSEQTHAIHAGVQCDQCGVNPIVGTRYKCSVRDNYDLCSRCEAPGTPYPTIKISNPEQLMGGQSPVHGSFPPRGRGGPFPHHTHPPHPHPPHHAAPHWGCWGPRRPPPPPDHSLHSYDQPPLAEATSTVEDSVIFVDGGVQPWQSVQADRKLAKMERRAVRQEQKNARHTAKEERRQVRREQGGGGLFGSGGGMFGMWRRGSNANSTPTVTATVVSSVDEDSLLDQALLDAVVRQSMEEGGAYTPTTVGNFVGTSPGGIQNPPAVGRVVGLEKLASAPPLNVPPLTVPSVPKPSAASKPMARFVKDVTFPDGTKMPPGGVVNKSWRVRNDGVIDWPEGVTLVCSGGDHLTPTDLAVSVPPVKAGEEVEISVTLTVPEVTGRHIAYFRFRTKEDSFFGQRLWADIRVTDDASEWHLVNGFLNETGQVMSSLESLDLTPKGGAIGSVDLDGGPIVDDFIENEECGEASTDPVVARWSTELALLKEMGFTDRPTIIPVLEEHLNRSKYDPAAYVEAIQRVVGALLNRRSDA